MTSERGDLVDLFDFVWERFTERMDGLTDPEWAWCPTADDRLGLRWRLDHIVELLTEARNWEWLGAGAPIGSTQGPASDSADSTRAALATAFTAWRGLVSDPAVDLAALIGEAAGPYGASTRRSLVLHVADELVHHTAEAALLRDLYAALP